MSINSTYFLNAADLASATAVYLDSSLDNIAPDDFYSNEIISRQQLGGVLLPAETCDCGDCLDCVPGLPIPIGTQKWTNCNLDVTTYSDGTVIPQVTDPTAWANLTTGAWCYYDNDPLNGPTYGKLYNWYAVAGIYDAASLANPTLRKKLAPTGYHVPTDAEWTVLTDYLGGYLIAGGKMKESGFCHWEAPNTGATNESLFTALPAGFRLHTDGSFNNIGFYGLYWSSTEFNTSFSWLRNLNYNSPQSTVEYASKAYGVSVRLIEDETVVLNPFDYIIVTYEYVPPVGLDYDLDTLTTFRYTDSTITGNTSSTIAGFIPGTGVVGCGTAAQTRNSTIPTGRAINNSYLTFGGDDNNQKVDGAYGESVVINFKILEDSGILDSTKNIIIAELFAGWHEQEGGFVDYPINIKYETYIGGIITNYVIPPIPPGTQTNRYIVDGTVPIISSTSNPITAARSGCANGVTGLYAKRKMASISYNRTTQEAFIIFS